MAVSVIRKKKGWSYNKVDDHMRGCELIKSRVMGGKFELHTLEGIGRISDAIFQI